MEINSSLWSKYRHKLINRMVKQIYVCEVCNLAYKDKRLAEECQAWCSQYNSCNLEITKSSIGEIKPIR